MVQSDSRLLIPIPYYCSLYTSIIKTCDFNDVYLLTMAVQISHKIPLYSKTKFNYDASMEISCKIIITLESYDFLNNLKHAITRYMCTQALKFD